MHDLAIEELKKDWEGHIALAGRGDMRSSYAAREVLERLSDLGCDVFWLEWARSCGPEMPIGKEAA